MSLMDALLLEEVADPAQIFIADRADRQRGAGSLNDPYDGGTIQGPEILGTPSYDPTEVIVSSYNAHNYNAHNYETGDIVNIASVTGPGMNEFNKAFAITVLTTVQFRFHLSRIPAAPPGAHDAPTQRHSGASLYDTLLASDPVGWVIDVDSSPDDPISDVLLSADMVNWMIAVSDPSGAAPGVQLFWPVARVNTSPANHGFVDFDIVTIANAADAGFHGNVAVVQVDATNFRYRLAQVPAADSSPSCTCSKIIHRFDEAMRNAPANAIIRLGPGTFETRGRAGAYVTNPNGYFIGFVLKIGQKVIGSGIGATVLKLVHVVDTRQQTVALVSTAPGFGQLTHIEVSDLTVDCNVAGQPVPAKRDFAPVVCGAAGYGGSYNRLHRLRAIGWGTQGYAECFVLGLGAAYTDPKSGVHNVISECILERPSENNTHESSTISNGGYDQVKADATSPVIRHCFVNCGYANGVSSELVSVQSLKADDTESFLMTGTFLDSGLLSWFCLDLQDYPDSYCLDPFQVAEGTLTTTKPHNRDVNNNVALFDVTKLGDPNVLHPALNGSFKVVQKISSTQLIFKLPLPPVAFPAYSVRQEKHFARIGVDFHGPAPIGGTGCITEGNSVYDCLNCFYTDTGSTRSVVVRNNYYSNIGNGVNINFSPVKGGAGEGFREADDDASAPRPLTHVENLAIFRAKAPHRFIPGQVVQIQGARINGILNNPYNPNGVGTFAIEAISATDPRVFYYRMTSDPVFDADVPTPEKRLQFRALWEIVHFVIENNLYDGYRTDANSITPPRAVVTYGWEPAPPYVFPQLVVRENIMRHIDHAASSANFLGQDAAFSVVDSTENGIIEENIVDVEHPTPLLHLFTKNLKLFANTNASGVLMRGHDFTAPEITTQKDDQLETLIEDAMTLCL